MFISHAAAAVAAGPALIGQLASSARAAEESPRRFDVCAFTKPFNSLSFDELADAVAAMGFDGIEAPVRRGGHVEPERVEEDLPKLVDALAKRDLKVAIATTDIARIDQPHAERTLRTIGRLGIPRFRLAYYQYDLQQPIPEQLERLRPLIADLVAAGREHGATPVYQNHSGRSLVGAPLWDLYLLAKDYSPDEFGVALDVGHATVEGGVSWPVQCRLLAPHLSAVYVKDFHWNDDRVAWNPLGAGRVDPTVFDWLASTEFSGPVSLHVEYFDHSDKNNTDKFLSAFQSDRRVLAGWLDSARG